MTDVDMLYRQALQGDSASEKELFQCLTVIFRMFVRRRGGGSLGSDDVEDIVQSAILKISESYRQVQIRSSFAAWAHSVAKNEFIGFYRNKSIRRRKLSELAVKQEVQPTHNPDSKLRDHLKDCLRRLHEAHPLHARVLNLHYLGYTTVEICDKLQITTGNLYVALHRARAALRACLRKKGAQGD
ncbi:MAG: RNA polymerase sigma factor [Candidatus Zixiibacteriota bacterium]|nr:MAG: RNA polymerase sigma factor [candidate division Zixibacteria bacterium]